MVVLRRGPLSMLIFATLAAIALPAAAEEAERTDLGWSNTTDLSLVVTQGNSDTETFGLNNRLRRRWQKSLFELRLDGVKSDTADDRYRQVVPDIEWVVGDTPPPDAGTFLVEPPTEPDVEKYSIEPSYSRTLSTRTYWNAGARWDRDVDAGLINRYVAYGTFGNSWYDREDLKFRTGYGLSYTDREEETPDPEKDETFAGGRLSLQYMNQFGANMTYENDWSINVSLRDTSDYSSDMLQTFSVSMTDHLSLKVSLQWLYNNEPALEDIDLVARVILIDPDETPGSGDEFFRTVTDGGAEITLDEVQERKDSLDTVFRTSLSIKF